MLTRAEDVLEQLRHLGHLGGGDRDDRLADAAVEALGLGGAGGGEAADDLRRVGQGVRLVARIDALGREGQVEVDAGLQAGLLEDRQQALARRARVGRRLQDDQLAGLQDVGDGLRGGQQRAEVGLAVRRQRGRDGDDDRVRESQARSARGGLQLRADGGELLRRDVLDVGLTATDRGHLGHARVDADHSLAGLGERDGQRKADVAESNDADGHASSLTVAHAIPSLRAWSWPRRACSPAISSAICSPSASRRLPEEPGGLGVAVLGRLELEDPVARPQLEVERQRPQQVLQRLIHALRIPQLAEAVAHSVVTSSVGHGSSVAARPRSWKVVFARGGGRVPLPVWGVSMPH